jgi:hypothetical protein
MNIDEMIRMNSEGRLDDVHRWDLKKIIELTENSAYKCIICEKSEPLMPSKALNASRYCRGHLLYAFVRGIDVNTIKYS